MPECEGIEMKTYKCPCGKTFTNIHHAQNHMFYCETAYKKLGLRASDPYLVKMRVINATLLG